MANSPDLAPPRGTPEPGPGPRCHADRESWVPPRLDPAPDPALSRAFVGCLPGGRIAGPLLAFASISSTQAICRHLATEGAPEGTVVAADYQTAGRGRRGRAWTAQPGAALLFSCVLRPSIEPARWPELTFAAACAVAEAVEATANVAPRVKWPNDVLIGERKLAGILADGVLGETAFVVLGIGINVAQGPEAWTPELAGRAVALSEAGHPVAREALLTAVLARLGARYEDLLGLGFGPVRDAWRARAALGELVHGQGWRGVAVDLAPSGGLVIRCEDGSTATILAGELGGVATLSPGRV